jgi:hypothetical protein
MRVREGRRRRRWVRRRGRIGGLGSLRSETRRWQDVVVVGNSSSWVERVLYRRVSQISSRASTAWQREPETELPTHLPDPKSEKGRGMGRHEL